MPAAKGVKWSVTLSCPQLRGAWGTWEPFTLTQAAPVQRGFASSHPLHNTPPVDDGHAPQPGFTSRHLHTFLECVPFRTQSLWLERDTRNQESNTAEE